MSPICNDVCKIFTVFVSWLAGLIGMRLVPVGAVMLADGCRQIPAGHFNFDPAMVTLFGGKDAIAKAIIYQKVMGWIETNRQRGRNLIDDQTWTYNTYPQWAKEIPLFHQKTIEKHIRDLEAMGLLQSEQFDQHKGNQRKYYTSPVSLSDDLEQMLLWPESLTPMTGGLRSADSSMNNQSKNNPSTIKGKTPTPTARGYEAQTAGAVAEFSIPTGELPDIQIQQPEARDAQDEHEAYAFQGTIANASATKTPPPVPPPPSPDDVPTDADTQEDESCVVPAWMPGFFDGCGPDELAEMLAEYGEGMLIDAKTFAENPDNGIKNPAGFVRAQLAKGWRPKQASVSPVQSSAYADFVMS